MDVEAADLQADYRRYLSAIVAFHLAAADHVGLHATDYEAMNVLGVEGSLTAGELAQMLGLTTGATTRLVDRLERVGLAQRLEDPADRRRTIVQVTGKPPDGLDEALATVMPAVGAAIAQLGPEQLAGFAHYVRSAAAGFQGATRKLRSAE